MLNPVSDKASALFTMTIAFGNILAPTIGGWLVDRRSSIAGSGNCTKTCALYSQNADGTWPATPEACTPWPWLHKVDLEGESSENRDYPLPGAEACKTRLDHQGF